MPIATPQQFAIMLDAAQEGSYGYPAVNCSSIVTINAALKGFSEKKSDGFIQFSTGAGQFASGVRNANATYGTIILAETAHRLAEQYDIYIAIHTDHCQPENAAGFLKPLIKETARRRAKGLNNLFQGHMLDASSLPLKENMEISREYLQLCAQQDIILEVEAGVVGGEEEGASNTKDIPDKKLYTTATDMLEVYRSLHGLGRYMFAATFGNVHGHYKPGAVKLRPELLRDGQEAVIEKYGRNAEFDLVFHGGSGSPVEQIRTTLNYGVVKMNIDTDTQYSFTRPIVDHVMKNYDGALMIDGGIGNKSVYDPRSYLKKAEVSMAERVSNACDDLRSTGQSLFGKI